MSARDKADIDKGWNDAALCQQLAAVASVLGSPSRQPLAPCASAAAE
jgi:hypothetical protein